MIKALLPIDYGKIEQEDLETECLKIINSPEKEKTVKIRTSYQDILNEDEKKSMKHINLLGE